LLTDRGLYEEESRLSRQRALSFVEAIQPDRMEKFLRSLPAAAGEAPAGEKAAGRPELLALSPEKRALLLARLRKSLGKGAG
jgi:hypothetical protein